MAGKNSARVIIGGKVLTLGGYESEEYFQKVASYMNNKILELGEMPGYSRQPVDVKNLLLSLNIADDFFKAKKQAEIFEEDLHQKDHEMYDLKHELVSLRMQLEETRRAYQESEQKRVSAENKVSGLEKEVDDLLK